MLNKKLKINHFIDNNNYDENNEKLFWKVYKNKYLLKNIWKHARLFGNVYYLTKYIYFEQDSLLNYPYWSYITVIALVGEFNYPLKKILPPYITRLTLREYSNNNDDGDQSLPDTINNLTIMDKLPTNSGNNKSKLIIPKSVVRLVFGGRFNQVIPIGFIVPTIKYLKFCYSFDQEIKPFVLPSTLLHIQFGSKWNKYLEFNYNLPMGLKTLILGSNYNGTINGPIPNSLELIHLPWYHLDNIHKNINLFKNINSNSLIYIGTELIKSKNIFSYFKDLENNNNKEDEDEEENEINIENLNEINKLIIASKIENLPTIWPKSIKELTIINEISNGINGKIPQTIEKLIFFSREFLSTRFFNSKLLSNDLPDTIKILDLGIQIKVPSKLPNLKELYFNPNLMDSSSFNLSLLPSSLEILKNNNQNQFYPISKKLLKNHFKNLKQLNGFLIVNDNDNDDNDSYEDNDNNNIENYTINNLLNEIDLNNLPINNKFKSLVIKGDYKLEILKLIDCPSLKNLELTLLNEEYEDSFTLLFRSLPKSIVHLKVYCDLFPDSPIQSIDINENLTNIDLILGDPWGKPMSIIEIDNLTINNLIIRTNCK
ncbi:hypothetical protein DDB_G0288905 [Dictyostelium discoideum AX4]|uniref:FNIP repeat-containing protein n=1 Tax=Dictyostelium discoideum TaxID=44689 RepID=Q54I99_DICDI|nr:hypothetical protein DDB_G0288905 [Dictyostelium discoideum AX4]EAL62976.1 hypothetical protein DDB_G0288905 [Dictyostelium discoideum AX4]|eukprot:XP_636480.1 hypothetical protein DDB_G0288905 [Dictyostelium discoideum AX4]